MIALIHGALGAACGMMLRRPAPTVAAALTSHFMVDAISHDEPFDENNHLRPDLIALDGLLLGLALVFVGRRYGLFSPETLGALAASLPDAEHLLPGRQTAPVPAVHAMFPHAVWPSKRISLRRQFLIGVAAWLAILSCASSARRGNRARAEHMTLTEPAQGIGAPGRR